MREAIPLGKSCLVYLQQSSDHRLPIPPDAAPVRVFVKSLTKFYNYGEEDPAKECSR